MKEILLLTIFLSSMVSGQSFEDLKRVASDAISCKAEGGSKLRHKQCLDLLVYKAYMNGCLVEVVTARRLDMREEKSLLSPHD